MDTPAQSPPDLVASQARTTSSTRRTLACALCQQRKVKCDRRGPCTNCVRSGHDCVPATLAQRRQRFPERKLLDRLRKYETLLRKNNIAFDPLHPSSTSTDIDYGEDVPTDVPRQGPVIDDGDDQERTEPKDLWSALTIDDRAVGSDEHYPDDDFRSSNADRNRLISDAWDVVFSNGEHLIFAFPRLSVSLVDLHPSQLDIFRLWQIYLDNVNPVLKVTHVPTLQTRLMAAVRDLSKVEPMLEALMFSIYCLALESIEEDDTTGFFEMSSDDLLARCRVGCQQALMRCKVLRTTNLDCVTALFFYMMSLYCHVDPSSLSAMMGMLVRVAQRLGLQMEAINAKQSIFDAEMRRRLWWAIVWYDGRIIELSNSKGTLQNPSWDCKPPLNVNDTELRPDMTSTPGTYDLPTDSIFAVVRSQLIEYTRHSLYHLDFTNPLLKPLARVRGPLQQAPASGETRIMDQFISEEYLKYCNPDNPLHAISLWTARATFEKCYLVEYYGRLAETKEPASESTREEMTGHAVRMIEYDTLIRLAPVTKPFAWNAKIRFPLPGYLYILQDLRARPRAAHIPRSWHVMRENFNARFFGEMDASNPFYRLISMMVLRTWSGREMAVRGTGDTTPTPQIVLDMRRNMGMAQEGLTTDREQATQSFPMTPVTTVSQSRSDDAGHMPVKPLPWGGINNFTNMPGFQSDMALFDLEGIDFGFDTGSMFFSGGQFSQG